jgi:hypothetical protein
MRNAHERLFFIASISSAAPDAAAPAAPVEAQLDMCGLAYSA